MADPTLSLSAEQIECLRNELCIDGGGSAPVDAICGQALSAITLRTENERLTVLKDEHFRSFEIYKSRAETAERALSETKYALAEVIAELREQVRERDGRIAGLEKVAQSVVDWNKKYPTSRIFSENEIRKIANEMDTINSAALAALTQPTRGEG